MFTADVAGSRWSSCESFIVNTPRRPQVALGEALAIRDGRDVAIPFAKRHDVRTLRTSAKHCTYPDVFVRGHVRFRPQGAPRAARTHSCCAALVTIGDRSRPSSRYDRRTIARLV